MANINYVTRNIRQPSEGGVADLFAPPAAAEDGLVTEVLYVNRVGHLLTLLLVTKVDASLANRREQVADPRAIAVEAIYEIGRMVHW